MPTPIDDSKETGITDNQYRPRLGQIKLCANCSSINRNGKHIAILSKLGGNPIKFLQNFVQVPDDNDYEFDPVLEENDPLAELFDGPVAPDDYETTTKWPVSSNDLWIIIWFSNQMNKRISEMRKILHRRVF